MKVIGLDLSLASTGIAIADEATNHSAYTIKPKETGHERLARLIRAVMTEACDADLVVIEGPAYGSQGNGERQKGHHERAGLWWLVAQALWDESIPYAVVPPSVLKSYVTGKGNANKDAMMLATARRFDSFSGDNNAADALWLAAAGAEHFGHPLVQLPQAQRDALAKVQWPQPIGADK